MSLKDLAPLIPDLRRFIDSITVTPHDPSQTDSARITQGFLRTSFGDLLTEFEKLLANQDLPEGTAKAYVDQHGRACRGCGKKILWGDNGVGTKIPLDAVAPCYVVIFAAADGRPLVKRASGAFVNHFNTCPQANEFNKEKKSVADSSPARPAEGANVRVQDRPARAAGGKQDESAPPLR